MSEVDKLRAAIKKHRDQKADDRCWLDDLELYTVLNEDVVPTNAVGDKVAMLENCRRFIERRCEAGGWPSYVELEARLEAADKLAEAAAKYRCLVRSEAPLNLIFQAGSDLDTALAERLVDFVETRHRC